MESYNKYYELYMNEEFGDEILDAKLSNFEDHFWHMLCLSVYYQKQNDAYLEKKCISKACDLNYAYTALLYFDKYGVLPSKYKQYTAPLSHLMKVDKIEDRINYFNKKDKRQNMLKYFLYSLISLVVIPVMLILVLVFGMDTTTALIISVILMLGLQFIFNPYTKKKFFKEKKQRVRKVETRLENYLKYYDRFIPLFKNDNYMDLIACKKEEDKQAIIDKIKAGDMKNV